MRMHDYGVDPILVSLVINDSLTLSSDGMHTANNKQSISLFKKNNFVMVGEKKDWILSNGAFKNEFLFQLINE